MVFSYSYALGAEYGESSLEGFQSGLIFPVTFDDLAISCEEMLFQIFLYENATTAKLSRVNIMHNDCLNGSIGFVHRKIAKVLQVETQILGKVTDLVKI